MDLDSMAIFLKHLIRYSVYCRYYCKSRIAIASEEQDYRYDERKITLLLLWMYINNIN